MPENEKDEGKVWEDKRVCSYCNHERRGEDLGLVHRNKKGNPDWSVCFHCFKKAIDKAIGKESKIVEKIEKCAYCEKPFFGTSGETPYFSHIDKEGNVIWGSCFECVKNAFDKLLKNEAISV